MPKIEIDIYAWPTRETEEPMGLQGDIYVDGEEVCGFTGPGDYKTLFHQGVDLLDENWSDWVRTTDEYEYPPATRIRDIEDIVGEKLARIRLGVYSENLDGSVQEILEEIERILR